MIDSNTISTKLGDSVSPMDGGGGAPPTTLDKGEEDIET